MIYNNMKDTILFPKSIAVVGVSQEKEKIGSVIYNNVIEGGYTGKIFPILQFCFLGKHNIMTNLHPLVCL